MVNGIYGNLNGIYGNLNNLSLSRSTNLSKSISGAGMKTNIMRSTLDWSTEQLQDWKINTVWGYVNLYLQPNRTD